MKQILVQKLYLNNYRNFEEFTIFSNDLPVMLLGDNGVGKTNILESISLLFPGKGIRSAKSEEICKFEKNNWHVTSILESKLGKAEVSVSFQNQGKKLIKFNGSKIFNSELSNITNIIWLVPQMDSIFLSNTSTRLKFLDRLVYNFVPSHAHKINRYDYYLRERLKILLYGNYKNNLLNNIEIEIAKYSLDISMNRLKFLNNIQHFIDDYIKEYCNILLKLDGVVENMIHTNQRNNIELYIIDKLYKSREVDKMLKRSSFGIHKTDFIVMHKYKNINAKMCSTGEQKTILITLILAIVQSLIHDTNFTPLLLLDDMFAHLDINTQEYLIDFLLNTKIQFWISATDCNDIYLKLNKFVNIINLNK